MSLILVFITLFSRAADFEKPSLHLCTKKINSELLHFKSKNEWVEVAPIKLGTRLFRSPTKDFGRWVQLQTGSDGYRLMSATSKMNETITLDADCKKTIQRFNAKRVPASQFRDQDILKIKNSMRPSMIYVWSPGMVYSVRSSDIFAQAAKDLKMNFVSVLDNSADENYARATLKHYNVKNLSLKKNASLELLMRETLVHFPSVLIVERGQVSRKPIVGVYTSEKLKEKLTVERLQL